MRVATLLAGALAALVPAAGPVAAASGGPDAAGYRWHDRLSDCSTVIEPFGPDLVEVLDVPVDEFQGPVRLPFAFPFRGELKDEAWLSPWGFLTFSPGQPADVPAQVLPDPAPPNDLIAAHWPGPIASLLFVDLRWELSPEQAHFEWVQLTDNSVTTRTHLLLFPNGDARIRWVTNREESHDIVIGSEDAAGADGTTLLQRTGLGTYAIRDGGLFPDAVDGRSACLEAPAWSPRVDCIPAERLGCGVTVGDTPPTADPQLELYGCSLERFTGNEKVYRFESDDVTDLDVSLDAFGRDVALFLLRGCSELECLDGGGASVRVESLPPGRHALVVDPRDPDQEGRFELDVACTELSLPVACGDVVAGTTVGGPSRLDSSACVAGDLTGPEALFVIDYLPPGNLSVAVDTDQAVSIFDADAPPSPERCLAAGVGGAFLSGPSAGTYVVVVDGPAGPGEDFELTVLCEPQIDCDGARLLGCNETLPSTTEGRSSLVDHNGCATALFDGPEAVHEFTNPMRQVVSFVLDDSANPDLDLYLLDDCDEGSCIAFGDASITRELPPGDYRVVVDGRAGAAAPFELTTICGNALEPASLTITSAEGACFQERKTAWVTPAIASADVLFSIDLTGSMNEEKLQLAVNMQDIIERLDTFVGDLAFGLASYRDYDLPPGDEATVPCVWGGYGVPGDYPYRLELPITTDRALIQEVVDDLPTAFGGGDGPEAYLRMYHEAATDPAIGWRSGARRLLVDFGDAIPHDCNVLECLGGVADFAWGPDLGPDGLADSGDELITLETLPELVEADITLLHLDSWPEALVDVGQPFTQLELWTCLTDRVGGAVAALEQDGTVPDGLDLAELIAGLVQEQGSLCDVLELRPSAGFEDWLVSASPIYLEQELPAVLPFDIEVCVPAGTPPGIYRFEVELTCDGGVAAVQELEIEVVTDCAPSVVSGPEDVTTCAGESALLDASGMSLVNCAGTVEHEWFEGPLSIGTGPTIPVSPALSTDYDVVVSCSSDPACSAAASATVDVHAPPLFDTVRAVDRAACNAGLEVSWDPATFLDPTGTGVYNVYRSELDCADAFAAPPIAVGLTGTSFTDFSTVPGATYHYLVEAEDARSPSACTPRGVDHGGTATTACAPPVTEVAIPTEPAGVFATLRVGHDGDEITAAWPAARPLEPGEHFHLLKALDEPTNRFGLVNGEADLSRSFSETDRGSALQFFDLRVANECEVESEDEYPPGP